MYGPLYFRVTEGEKAHALKQNKGNFDAHMALSASAIVELQWWINNIETAHNLVCRPEPHIIMCTDASKGLFIWAEVIPVSEKTFRQVYERDLALLRK
jgi:hypothetical protein